MGRLSLSPGVRVTFPFFAVPFEGQLSQCLNFAISLTLRFMDFLYLSSPSLSISLFLTNNQAIKKVKPFGVCVHELSSPWLWNKEPERGCGTR